ncbi:hypothetical protein D7M10_24265 [Pseudomonas fluorescens]|nr:hypothetical protein D7M10_24265 [Pseudomonas fluorescens]
MGLWGSGLARDSIISVCQSYRVACIASKPAPTQARPYRGTSPLMERIVWAHGSMALLAG